MQVIATKRGYYGKRFRYEGDTFDIEPKKFSARWMKKVEPETKPVKAANKRTATVASPSPDPKPEPLEATAPKVSDE